MPSGVAQPSARKNEYNTRAVGVATLDKLKVGVWECDTERECVRRAEKALLYERHAAFAMAL
jgi:hypothetical protein